MTSLKNCSLDIKQWSLPHYIFLVLPGFLQQYKILLKVVLHTHNPNSFFFLYSVMYIFIPLSIYLLVVHSLKPFCKMKCCNQNCFSFVHLYISGYTIEQPSWHFLFLYIVILILCGMIFFNCFCLLFFLTHSQLIYLLNTICQANHSLLSLYVVENMFLMKVYKIFC